MLSQTAYNTCKQKINIKQCRGGKHVTCSNNTPLGGKEVIIPNRVYPMNLPQKCKHKVTRKKKSKISRMGPSKLLKISI